MNVKTRREIIQEFTGCRNLDDVEMGDEVLPIIGDAPQRQGDVGIFPKNRRPSAGSELVPAEGIAVVTGVATGNAHILFPGFESKVWFRRAPLDGPGVLIGEIHVEEGVGYVRHTDEHQLLGFPPGVYDAKGKREQREEIARVQD